MPNSPKDWVESETIALLSQTYNFWMLKINNLFSQLHSVKFMYVTSQARRTEDWFLEQVSPATVSRCGVVYHGLPTVGWESLAKSWLSSPAEYHTGLSINYLTLFHWIIPPALDFVRTRGRLVMKAGLLNSVRYDFSKHWLSQNLLQNKPSVKATVVSVMFFKSFNFKMFRILSNEG